ncbi:MAG TPA: cellulase family glycosylhydrolase [Armatimonadota bacterium]|nr:cellulase family glycosylhydrolase [Armatimonadota bacterium]
MIRIIIPLLLLLLLLPLTARAKGSTMPWVRVAADRKGFVLEPGDAPFVPWGFNYDHDDAGRLLEDYWEADWPAVETHFSQMKTMGANVVRVHLQIGAFMESPTKPRTKSLDRLARLARLAERLGLYLDLTGLGCYDAQAVPAWYTNLPEQARWDVQTRFWRSVAKKVRNSPAVFCFDLMNEPVVSGTPRKDGDWLAPPFGGKSFVQFINLDPKGRARPAIAQAWMRRMVSAIRKVDRRHLVTVGLIDWNSEHPGALSGFVPEVVAPELDFVSVHVYPEKGKVDEAVQAMRHIDVNRPILVEEMFPLHCSVQELEEFIDRTKGTVAGWIGFYWGKPPDQLRQSGTIGDAITLAWLELFEKKAAEMKAAPS